jgi:hypothetical protein
MTEQFCILSELIKSLKEHGKDSKDIIKLGVQTENHCYHLSDDKQKILADKITRK